MYSGDTSTDIIADNIYYKCINHYFAII